VANPNFFCRVLVLENYSLDAQTFAAVLSKVADPISLRAEKSILAIISNCPHTNNPCRGGKPTPFKVTVVAATTL
jgi:uncharacterized protein YcgI (DUF1989 family)